MDWDGIGTFAFFIASGGMGVAWIAFRAYKAKLQARIEMARLGRSDVEVEDALEQVRELEEKVLRLTERVDFTERLLGEGAEAGKE